MARQIIDITLALRETMTVYEGDPPFRCRPLTQKIEANLDSYNTSALSFGTHTGTHIDPPRHFDNQGQSVDRLDLSTLCGPARVFDLRGRGCRIDEAVVRGCDGLGVERWLLRTDSEGWADRPFDRRYAHLTLDAACWLRSQGVRLIGIDSPSVEAFDSPTMPVHRMLLTRHPAVLVLEGLDLTLVQPGDYELFCLPLKLEDGDGGPARAILVRN